MNDAGATAADSDERVARAAAELGIPVPARFRLLGDQDGELIAVNDGTARDYARGAAILARLQGRSVEQSLAVMTRPGDGPPPAWAPPPRWDEDPDVLLTYLAERAGHPEWPQVINGPDWVQTLLISGGGGLGLRAIAKAAAAVYSEQIRVNLARYLVDKAVEQGVPVDPAEILRAFGQPGTAGRGESDDPARAPGDGAGRE